MTECYDETKALLESHRDQLKQLTDALVEQETLTDVQVRALLGFPARDDESVPGADAKEPEAT